MKIICDFSVFYLDETLPKGSIVVECGNALLKNGYKLKILNTINFKKSMHYNPFSYVHSEKDILKLVTTLMTNTKGEGSGGDPFWEKSERLLLTALIAYLHYEAPVEEQNFATLLEMLNTMQVLEDDEEYQNPVDLLFEELAKKKPNSFAGRQYKLYKLAAGKTAKLRFIILLLARWTCPNNRPTYPTYLMCRIGTAKFFTLLLLLYHT